MKSLPNNIFHFMYMLKFSVAQGRVTSKQIFSLFVLFGLYVAFNNLSVISRREANIQIWLKLKSG